MRSLPVSILLLSFMLAVPVAGCEQLGIGAKKEEKKAKKDTDDEDDEEEKATATATVSATATASATAQASATASASATETAVASASASGTAALLPGHTAIPTVEEWDAVKEVSVLNAQKLGCESKALREWVRISCKNKNDTGGTPSSVTVDKGGDKGDTFTLNEGGIASLVYPFQEGRDLEATFTWTDKSVKLKSAWPQGAPKPPAYGAFDAAPAPIAKVDPKKPGPVIGEVIKRPVGDRPTSKRPEISKPVLKVPTKDSK